MKTTVELPDALVEAAKRHARARGTTLKAVMEEGLRAVLRADDSQGSFELRDASVDGRGLRPDVREGGWERIAELFLYQGVREFWTADRDFSRFPALPVKNPLVAEDLDPGSSPSDPSAVFDLGSSGSSDIAENKDAMIGETFHVLVETWTLLRWRMGWDAAEAFWEGLRGAVATVETVGPADLQAAWTTGRDYAGQHFSLVDRTSFAVMERLGLERVASFDSDFAAYRWGPRRDRAFQLLR